MKTSVACPTCGAPHLENAPVCPCGHTFSQLVLNGSTRLSDAKKAGSIERPFDVGKPLGTHYPVSQGCPACGANDHTKVKPEAMIAFASDRVCRRCATRYTPPTPLWGRAVFGVIGISAVAVGSYMLYDSLIRGNQNSRGLIAGGIAILVGLGCLYKAVTK